MVLIHFVMLLGIVGLFCFTECSSFKIMFHPSVRQRHMSRHLFGKDSKPEKKGGGMFEGMGNLMESMKQAQEIAKKAEIAKKELSDTTIIGQPVTGSGVKATFDGLGMPKDISIADSCMNLSASALSILAKEALTDGYTRSQKAMMAKMSELYGGAVPGLPAT